MYMRSQEDVTNLKWVGLPTARLQQQALFLRFGKDHCCATEFNARSKLSKPGKASTATQPHPHCNACATSCTATGRWRGTLVEESCHWTQTPLKSGQSKHRTATPGYQATGYNTAAGDWQVKVGKVVPQRLFRSAHKATHNPLRTQT